MAKAFYTVWIENTKTVSKKYEDGEAAHHEAERLAKANPTSPVHVMKSYATASAAPKVDWEDYV